MRAARAWVGLLLGALVAAPGCGDDGASSRSRASTRAVLHGDGRAFVPTTPLPGDLHLRLVDPSTGPDRAAWIALYGDPDAEDPLAGEVVHVVYAVGSDTRSPWPEGVGGETWILGRTDDDDSEADEVVVGGRGFEVEELRGLLDRVVLDEPFEPDHELRAAHLSPVDLGPQRALLAEGSLDFSEAWWTYQGVLRGGPALQWVGPEHNPQLRLSTVKDDPATSLLLRSMIDDAGGTVLRGIDGAFGRPTVARLSDGPEVLLAAWHEDGLAILVQAYGLTADEVKTFMNGLRITVDDDWPALVDLAEQAPPIMHNDGTELARGSFDGGRWWVELAPGGPTPQFDQWIESADGRFFNAGGGGGCYGSSVAHTVGLAGSLLSGLAPSETVHVVVGTGGGGVDVVAESVPGGASFWTLWLEGEIDVTEIVAYDAAGAVLERIDPAQISLADEPGSSAAVCIRPTG